MSLKKAVARGRGKIFLKNIEIFFTWNKYVVCPVLNPDFLSIESLIY